MAPGREARPGLEEEGGDRESSAVDETKEEEGTYDDGEYDDDEQRFADDTEEMIRFSSHLIQSYLEEQRQTSEPLLGDDDERDRDREARQSSSDDVAVRREGCPCRIISGLDAILGISLFFYGLALPLMVLIRGTFYRHKTAVPLAATAASIVLGSVLVRSGAKGRWPAPAVAALFELSAAIFSGLKWDVLAKYTVDHRETMLLRETFVERVRDDARVRVWTVAVLSILAASELCRALAMARESRRMATVQRQTPQSSSSLPRNDLGPYQRLEDEENGGGDDWAADNARRWERWRDECDPGLRDRRGNYDPDALRRYGSSGPRQDGDGDDDEVEEGRNSLEEPLLGHRREESFEVRHGLSRRGRGKKNDGGTGSGGGTSGLLSGLKFWGKKPTDAPESADARSLGDESSVGFAPVEGDVPEPGGSGLS